MNQYKTRDAERRLATLVMAPNEFGRPSMAPGYGGGRLKTLREACSNTFKDPELLARRRSAAGR